RALCDLFAVPTRRSSDLRRPSSTRCVAVHRGAHNGHLLIGSTAHLQQVLVVVFRRNDATPDTALHRTYPWSLPCCAPATRRNDAHSNSTPDTLSSSNEQPY